MAEAAAIILAAGQGTRMNSDLAKVLHRLAGLEMVNHAVRNVRLAQFEQIIVVVGYQGEQVKAALEEGVLVVEQKEQLGTGHAVDQCRDVLRGFQGPVLVTYGDTPLFRSETFQELLAYHVEQGAAATIRAEMSKVEADAFLVGSEAWFCLPKERVMLLRETHNS